MKAEIVHYLGSEVVIRTDLKKLPKLGESVSLRNERGVLVDVIGNVKNPYLVLRIKNKKRRKRKNA